MESLHERRHAARTETRTYKFKAEKKKFSMFLADFWKFSVAWLLY